MHYNKRNGIPLICIFIIRQANEFFDKLCERIGDYIE